MTIPKAYSYTRMSTLDQIKGDSPRRQRAMALAYAEKNGLEIEDRFDDWGISAFRGKNSDFGALKVFKDKLEAGEIAKGSHLIVESMDRLSRQPVMKALEILTGIVGKGVVLVTLDDGQIYSSDTIKENSYRLIVALTSMSRAHEESRRKSGLVAAAWSEKRKKAREGVVSTKRVPGWLTVKDGKVELIPERGRTVLEIFQLTRDGWGAYSVCRRLNERREPVWSSRKNAVWRESYIKKMVASRTVLGEYQPHRIVTDECEVSTRLPEGDPIVGYYPAVVPLDLYVEANAATERRRTGGKGRKGIRYANLFSGLLRCGCGAGYRFIDKGKPPKGGQYLQCTVAHLNGKCSSKTIHYELMEELLLNFIESLDVSRVLGGERQNKILDDLQFELAEKKAQSEKIDSKIENIVNAISEGEGNSQALAKKLGQLESESSLLKKSIAERGLQIEQILLIDPAKRQAVVDDLLAKIRNKDVADVALTRRALVGELQRMLDRIVVTPNIRVASEVIEEFDDWKERCGTKNVSELEKMCSTRWFEVLMVYRNGDTTRIDSFEGPIFKSKGRRLIKDWNYLEKAKLEAGKQRAS